MKIFKEGDTYIATHNVYDIMVQSKTRKDLTTLMNITLTLESKEIGGLKRLKY